MSPEISDDDIKRVKRNKGTEDPFIDDEDDEDVDIVDHKPEIKIKQSRMAIVLKYDNRT